MSQRSQQGDDNENLQNEITTLEKKDLKQSRAIVTLFRCMYLFFTLFSFAVIIDEQLKLQALKQSISLLLIAAQIFTICWNNYQEIGLYPPFKQFYSNCIFVALFLFHLHTICEFFWNPYLYIFLSAFVISHLVKSKLSDERSNYQYLFVQITVVCIIAIVGLKIEEFEYFIPNNWDEIIILPTAIAIILHIWILFNTLIEGINMYYFKHHLKQPLRQRILAFFTFSFLLCTYYSLIFPFFLSKEACQVILKIYFVSSLLVFTIASLFEQQVIVILCKNPKTGYRHSQTMFDSYFHSIKRQNKCKWEVQFCVLCYKNIATILFDKCKHLAYCQKCQQKAKQKEYFSCPICSMKPYFHKVFVIEMSEKQRKGYKMKLYIKSKLAPNQYLINREEWYR